MSGKRWKIWEIALPMFFGLVLIGATPAVTVRGPVTAAPDRSVCSPFNSGPLVAKAADMPTLLDARGQPITGRVDFHATINARSKLQSLTITHSSDHRLDAAALKYARLFRFRTAMRDCVPVASSLDRTAIFVDRRVNFEAWPSAMSDYFLGVWACESLTGLSDVHIFSSNYLRVMPANLKSASLEFDDIVFFPNASIGSKQAVFSRDRDGYLMSGVAGDSYRSRGWVGDEIRFEASSTEEIRWFSFQRRDADHYRYTKQYIGPSDFRIEECRRVATPTITPDPT